MTTKTTAEVTPCWRTTRPTPGEVLGDFCLESLRVSVTDAATDLGVSRKTLSSILNGRAGIGPEMAARLSIAFPPTADASRRGGAVRRAEQRRGALKVAPLTLG